MECYMLCCVPFLAEGILEGIYAQKLNEMQCFVAGQKSSTEEATNILIQCLVLLEKGDRLHTI